MSINIKKFMKVKELIKQHEEWFSSCLPLVASENLTSYDVRKAVSSDFIHRYAEGPPGARIYAGCRYMDEVEEIAVETAKELFHAEFADVRPISGLLANLSSIHSTNFSWRYNIIFTSPLRWACILSRERRKWVSMDGSWLADRGSSL